MYNLTKYIFALLVLGSTLAAGIERNVTYTPVVQTIHGKVRGIELEAHDGKKIYSYLGIRYGTAVRFDRPTTLHALADVYQATHARFACPQVGMTFDPDHAFEIEGRLESNYTSEDCLFLNIWRPADQRRKLPVLVWIHGGGFKEGTIFADIHDGRELAALGDIVVVSIAYRLGVFGFSAGPRTMANQGIYDQKQALEWIHISIDAFGGDPDQVTVMGESAGSMSVGNLLLEPASRKTFQRAIMQSGAPIAAMSSQTEGAEVTLNFAKRFGCAANATPVNAAIDCMRDLTVHQIINKTAASYLEDLFLPVYGNSLFPSDPVTMLKALDAPFDLIYGVVKNEGAGWFDAKLRAMPKLNVAIVRGVIKSLTKLNDTQEATEIADFYTRNLTNESSVDQLIEAVANCFGDLQLACPTLIFGDYLVQHPKNLHANSKHYAYLFDFPSRIPGIPAGKDLVYHSSDVQFVFGLPLRHTDRFSDEDRAVSKSIMIAWTNFVKHGAPGKVGGIEWTATTEGSSNKNGTLVTKYMVLNPKEYRISSGLFKERCDIWRKVYNI